jgi:hypothetical protein
MARPMSQRTGAIAPVTYLRVAQHRPRALECRLEDRLVAIPWENVEGIAEYEVVALPEAREPVRGISVVRGKLVLSLGLGACPDGRRRRARGVVLRTTDEPGRWIFEMLACRALFHDLPSIPQVDVPRLASDAVTFLVGRGT